MSLFIVANAAINMLVHRVLFSLSVLNVVLKATQRLESALDWQLAGPWVT